jgi:hypothetical protein
VVSAPAAKMVVHTVQCWFYSSCPAMRVGAKWRSSSVNSTWKTWHAHMQCCAGSGIINQRPCEALQAEVVLLMAMCCHC